MDPNQDCYLLKHEEGEIFGPTPFHQLQQWAHDAQISPLDKVSTDEKTWVKAPMIPALDMDYLIEVGPDQYYGPTTLGAVKEFVAAGEITADTILTNCHDGVDRAVGDFPELLPPPAEENKPVRTSIRLSLQQRIRELEETLMEERRAREVAEAQCAKLEAKLAGLAGTLND
jgi:peptidoglycan hydrolase-like protein with peptidoglycan-binding domain